MALVALFIVALFTVVGVIAIGATDDPLSVARRSLQGALVGGLIAGALVEIGIELTVVRGVFHLYWINRAFDERHVALTRLDRLLSDDNQKVVRSELIHDYYEDLSKRWSLPFLWVGDHDLSDWIEAIRNGVSDAAPSAPALLAALEISRLSYLDGPVEQVAGQLGEVADSAIVIKRESVDVLYTLAGAESIDLVNRVLVSDDDLTLDVASQLRSRIDARIDAFQINANAAWQRITKLGACLLAAIASALIAQAIRLEGAGVLAAAVVGFTLGGVTAWVLRDLVSFVRRLATR